MDVKPTSEHGQSVPDGTCGQNDLPGRVDLLCCGPIDLLCEGPGDLPRRLSPDALWAAHSCGPWVQELLLQHCADCSLVPLQIFHMNCASIFVLQNRLHAQTVNVFSVYQRGLPSCGAALLCLHIRPDGLAQKP